ncbi:hypothetical protein Bca4012_060949 [Brassica carinata]
MGNCGSFQISCDQTLDRISTFLFSKGYIGNLEENLNDLKREMKLLIAIKDEVMNKVEREEPTRENGCKVAFTTRSKEVCVRMGDHEPMQIKCLEEDEAWELFKGKIGDEMLRRETLIEDLARKVSEKCDGLYDNLVDEQIKSCFLYCALFPEDEEIDKDRLIEYWICEGFMGEYQVLKSAINKGYVVLGILISANLLTRVNTEKVIMHDVVREMALWIASDLGEKKENFVVQAGVGLREVPKVKDWGAVRRMSLMGNKIQEMTCSSNCSELTTLLLQNNSLKNLSGEFIKYLKKLPDQISELTSLQYLDLSNTRIKQLPVVGFQELKKLTHLNLTATHMLFSVSGISNLSSLRTSPCFTNLSNVYIMKCRSIKDLTWLLFTPNLVKLYITNSDKLEEVINKEKATKLTGISPFQKLELLSLDTCPRLESIYWSPLPFPTLRRLEIRNCPKLRKLPLNATSVSRVDELSILVHPREQQTELKWEDEDTLNRFLPLILKVTISLILFPL